MRMHILGICGTFMGGVAALAHELGYQVEGSDANVYPPMSSQLEALGIELQQGYSASHLKPPPDQVVIGNALSRGNDAVEYVLNAKLPYQSGPAWLGNALLRHRQVLAVAGTHGKTTTSSLLAHILQQTDHTPGFLIGGVPGNFDTSARVGKPTSPFVIEADEYDTAFFDKRSKFVHYHADIAILNNLEYDHADIFPDVDAIKRQFHHFVRTIPANGRVIVNAEDSNLAEVLAMGCWTPVETFGIDCGNWRGQLLRDDGSRFRIYHRNTPVGEVVWPLLGRHNVMNALAAVAAAHAAGCHMEAVLACLSRFGSVKRRMEWLADVEGVHVYDDFAHHPTAIASTLNGLRHHVGASRIVVALEMRSNSMRAGVHAEALAPSLQAADQVFLLDPPSRTWHADQVSAAIGAKCHLAESVDTLLDALIRTVRRGDYVVFMSNGSFNNASRRFIEHFRK